MLFLKARMAFSTIFSPKFSSITDNNDDDGNRGKKIKKEEEEEEKYLMNTYCVQISVLHTSYLNFTTIELEIIIILVLLKGNLAQRS